jgi:hypothetical protein
MRQTPERLPTEAALHLFNERLSPDDVKSALTICHLNGVVVIICVTNGFNATTARHFPKAVHILLIVMNIRNRSSLTVALMSTLAIGHEPIFSSHLLMFGWLIDRQQPTKSSAVPIETF